MVERQVGGDPPRPSREVSVRPELLARPIDAPESLYGQILCDVRIAHDAHNPGVNVALELPDQCLESIDIAKRKSSEQPMSSSTIYYGVGTSGLQVFSLLRWTKGETMKSQSTDWGEIRERCNESDALVC